MHYSAMLGEMLHIGIKADARRTNGRDAEDQVSPVEFHRLCIY